MADELLIPGRSLRDLIDDRPSPRGEKTAAPPPGGDTDDWLMLPAHGSAYQARSRASTKPVATLHLLLADSSSRGFSYANLDTVDFVPDETPGKGRVLVLTFAGVTPKEVRIFGRNLELIGTYIGQHRLAWLRELPAGRDFAGDGEKVITGIAIKPVGP